MKTKITNGGGNNKTLSSIEIRKKTAHMGVLVVRLVSKDTARRLVLAGHYSHKWQTTFGIYSFGIFREGEEAEAQCLGVAAYGYMKTPKAKCFESAVDGGWMIELNRMWVDDCLGKNAESILIGASIKMLRQLDPTIVAIQSFADGRIGCGTIYKAANFQYYGWQWTQFFTNRRSGEVSHKQIITNLESASGFLRLNAALLAGDLDCFRVKTHRYIYPLHKSFRFIGNGHLQPYPAYEKGTEAIAWHINPARLRPRLIAALDTLLARYPHTTPSRPPA